MQSLDVTPAYLEELAQRQDQASAQAESATKAVSDVKTALWVSHGVASGWSNTAFTRAVAARAAAGQKLQQSSTTLAVNLRDAKTAYENTDAQAHDNLDQQALDS
ncbi:hypothetical protein A5641_19390 [Mycobacterium sp. 1554424.7]|nr:hypothetical protein A5641_05620 [Mycobacterium sp. 1554424.7]OBA77142.1 hypothetical protein A5641_19390 [Mycobacterium sp. 1554424.7]